MTTKLSHLDSARYQLRLIDDEALAARNPGGARPPEFWWRLREAVHAILCHLEMHEPRDRTITGALDPLVTPDEAAGIDETVREHFEHAQQKTADMAARLDGASTARAAEAMERRALIAEQDAMLAWRRVTELQARGTELVLERRAAHEALARLANMVRLYAASLPRPFDERIEAIVAQCEGKP